MRAAAALAPAVTVPAAAEALLDLGLQRRAVALVGLVPAAERQLAALRGDQAERDALVEQVDQLGARRGLDLGGLLAELGGQVVDDLALEAGGVGLHALLDGLVQLLVRRVRLGPVAAAALA